jgi:molecular chaperone GrpE
MGTAAAEAAKLQEGLIMSEREPRELWEETEDTAQNDSQEQEEAGVEEAPGGEPDYRDRWLRAAAEVDNLIKRTRRDVERARRSERTVILKAFLDVLDNFDRALAMEGAETNQWLEGFEATRRQMLETLEKFGARPFTSEGELFDPHRHEALGMAKVPNVDEGTIVEVIQTGYTLDNEELLRPAKVIVAS